MPRTRWSPETDAPLLDAVFDPSRSPGFSARTQVEIADVRAVYVETLGWGRERLAKYRFRVLAATARRTPETAPVLLRPPADTLPTLPEALLEAQLAHMSALPMHEAQSHYKKNFESVTEVLDFVDSYKIQLADGDYQKLTRIAQALGVPIRPNDTTKGNPDLSRAISRIVEEMYDRIK